MEKNTEIYFDEDFDKKYYEFIESKNVLSSKHINIFYEFLLDILSDGGINFKTWIDETNFRKYILDINSKKKAYSLKLDEYIESNGIENEKAITLRILKKQVEEKIENIYNHYLGLLKKIEKPIELRRVNLKDFFIDDFSEDKIKEIQSAYMNLNIGKEMAVLIHLLIRKEIVKKFDNSNRNSKTGKSRIYFVKAFTNNYNLSDIKGVNNFLDSEENLKTIRPTKKGLFLDETYNSINKQLDKIVSNY